MRYALLSCSLLGSLFADEVSLGVAGKISGTVESVNETGEMLLRSPLSPDPLIVEGKHLRAIEFEKKQKSSLSSPNVVYLKNGEVFPAEITSLDDKKLECKTGWAGNLSIDRQVIDSLHFGTSENELLYRGPNDKEWQLGSAWKFNDDGLVSSSYGPVSRKFESFPERYIIGFTCSWVGNAGIQCFFAGSSANQNDEKDAYMLTFNNGGLELKRRSTHSNKYTSLAGFNDFLPQDMEDNEIDVEVRVDNTNRLLQLIVNGKVLRSSIIDPEETGPMPKGSMVNFICTSGPKDTHTLTNIRLSAWGSSGAEARLEKRTDHKNDVMFDVESNRSTGVLKSITTDKEPMILFENPHDPEPKPLAASKVAVIYFSGEAPDSKKPTYELKLVGIGRLQIDSFTIADGTLHSTHPLLGELQIPTALIIDISRAD